MTDEPMPPEELTPAQQRVREHLVLLRREAPELDPALTERTMRSARWQRALRRPLRLAGVLAAALGEGIVVLLGGRRGSRQ